MRPEPLVPLFATLASLPGIGPTTAKAIERLTGGGSIIDLLLHLPTALVDRRQVWPIGEAPLGRLVTVEGTVMEHRAAQGRGPARVVVSDTTGAVEVAFFHARSPWLRERLPLGRTVILSGRLEMYRERRQMTHPEAFGPAEERDEILVAEPIYPLTQGLTNRVLRRSLALALERVAALPEWHDPALVAQQGWPSWREAVIAVHRPLTQADLSPDAPPRRRLAYDELVANQVALALIRNATRRQGGQALVGDGRLRARLLGRLPWALTASQQAAIADITADMAAPERMMRLVQGDVGSGKTVVALMAIATAIEAGCQAALMAPTEILARQHGDSLLGHLAACGHQGVVLTGRDKGRARDAVLMGLAEGTISLAIGTHALFQEEVSFRRLGLVVIDEQHRFGVHQRLALSDKGGDADVLVMTATPIPRTLTLTAYGDMDVSRMTGKPPGRQPVRTAVMGVERLDALLDRLAAQIAAGNRAFWVCPVVEENETSGLTSAEERLKSLRPRFGERVGLIHGRMKPDAKDKVMAAFASGGIDLLVATTVIEVGVNVPEATVMVIEHAERFGLAQLHQLRGRVGRGDRPSSCVLLWHGPLTETQRARLQVLRDSEDGFEIAEKDLELRGAGELLGTRQSGLPEFALADLAAHQDLMAQAHQDARAAVESDGGFSGPRGQALRMLLSLFRRDEAITYLRSG